MTVAHVAGAMALLLATSTAWAQDARPAPTLLIRPAIAPAPRVVHIPAETTVAIEVTQPLGSRTSHIGDMFSLRLAAPIGMNGEALVPAGAFGTGEVIDAKASGLAAARDD